MNTVLIVDDEESIQYIASAILQKSGYRTVSVETADEAEKAIAEGDIDVALIDVVLPGRGGLDLLMSLRVQKPDLPVIIMSGKVETDTELFGKLVGQFGAKSILSKPFSANDLTSAVAAVLSDGRF